MIAAKVEKLSTGDVSFSSVNLEKNIAPRKTLCRKEPDNTVGKQSRGPQVRREPDNSAGKGRAEHHSIRERASARPARRISSIRAYADREPARFPRSVHAPAMVTGEEFPELNLNMGVFVGHVRHLEARN